MLLIKPALQLNRKLASFKFDEPIHKWALIICKVAVPGDRFRRLALHVNSKDFEALLDYIFGKKAAVASLGHYSA